MCVSRTDANHIFYFIIMSVLKRESSHRLLLSWRTKGIVEPFNLAYDRQHQYVSYKYAFVWRYCTHLELSFTTIFGTFLKEKKKENRYSKNEF